MNSKTAKKLRKKALKLALHTVLAADAKGLTLTYGKQTAKKIYTDLKKGKLNAR